MSNAARNKKTLIMLADAWSVVEFAWVDDERSTKDIYDVAKGASDHNAIKYLCASDEVRVVVACKKGAGYSRRFNTILYAAMIAVQSAGYSVGKLITVDRDLKDYF